MALLLAGLGLDAIDPAQERSLVDTAFLDFLIDALARLLPFDPAFYAASYPDVAEAHASGEVADLHQHFVRYGFREGRLPHPVPFDPDYYLRRNPDLAGVLHDHGRPGLAAHFDQEGRREGRAGHPSAQAEADRWWTAVQRTPVRLAHRSIDGAAIQAFLPPLMAGPPLGFRGGLVLGDTPADRRLRHRRGANVVDSFPPGDQPVRALAGEYVYGGPYFDHFGHAMAELIHRVLPARAVFDCRRLLFVGIGVRHRVAGFAALPPVMQAPLTFLGVAPGDVTVIHDHRVVERLHVAEQGATLTGGPSPPYLRMLGDYTPRRLAELHDGSPAARWLYVSRSQVPHGGTVLGETYLEQLLVADGWRVLHPQRLSLVGQMQAYAGAEAILFPEGSACHGTELFGAGALGHCVLLPRRQNSVWWFENVLRPRARRFDVLPAATLLGTVLVTADTGAALDNLGVSLLDIAAVAEGLRGLGLARLAGLDVGAYRRAAAADLAAYRAMHTAPEAFRLAGTRLAEAASLAAFDARAAAALAQLG